jgi:hypothetical protein
MTVMNTSGSWTSRVVRGLLVLALVTAVSDVSLLAQRNRGNVRSSSRASTHSRNRNNNVNRNRNRNNNRNVNRNVNRNINRNIDIDRDIDVHVDHHYGYGGCCYRSGWGTAAAVATTAVVTAAVVGSVVRSLPPSCSTVIVNGFAYQQCGTTWYQPQITSGSTTYVVVNAPR